MNLNFVNILNKFHESCTYQIKKIWVLVYRYLKNRSGENSEHSEISQFSGTSFPYGKKETIAFIESLYPNKDIKILDVGPGQGVYNKMLHASGYNYFDAVEIYKPYIKKFELNKIYKNVFHCDIVNFEYNHHYDIIIMGDIIEHLKVNPAKKVIQKAKKFCNLLIVAIPYKMKQIGSQLDGSGDHKQPDLTRELFFKRYSGFELLIDNAQLGVFFSKQKKSDLNNNIKINE